MLQRAIAFGGTFPTAVRKSIRTIGHKLASMASVEVGKKCAAYKAVDEWLMDEQVVGIGSGTTVVYAVERIAELVTKHQYKIQCIPTSYQALQLIKAAKLPLTSLTDHPLLDVAFDGVDEITPEFASIKGGGGCLIQEKIVDANAKYFIAVADEGKLSKYLGEHWARGLPIEVIPIAATPIKLEIEKRFGGEVNIRMGVAKMGPVISDNGNFIMDWKFEPTPSIDWQQINVELNMIPGVVGTGLFLGTAHQAYLGTTDGRVSVLKNPNG
ncbi:ribose 5 phosphate isomerase [Echinococcus multilocularis]|uniref:ribose-5-phosphate isomerase n=1 Tax=Echinococcus multilocularis TaxID=6211 RepID=A0A068XYK6_ECHMU|nr:ribose 5 phosphate isomerase [Echinococcus multilocularis]